MQKAGLGMADSFATLSESADDPGLARVFEEVSVSLAQGHTIAHSLARFPRLFTAFHLHLIKLGQETGTLALVLARLAEREEAQQRLSRKVRAALTYPSIVAVVALLGLVLVPPYILEGVFQAVRQSGIEPPPLTRAVMAVSQVASSPWTWGLLGLVAFWGLPRLKAQLESARWRPALLQLPGLGSCLQLLTAARFSASLALCQRAGMNIQRSLDLSAAASADPLLVKRLHRASQHLEEGGGIAESLETTGVFSPLFLEILACGEETGRTEKLLEWLAKTSEQELEVALQTYASLLEPLMLLCVGFLVGVLVLATATPMLSVVQNL